MARNFPPLGSLRAFEAAARLGSFKHAADELGVSPSAISHHIRHLEDILGLDLFHRSARAIDLTPAGARLFPYLKEGFDQIWAGTRAVRAVARPDVLAVQTYSTIAVRWLIPRLGSFRLAHPGIDLRIITSQIDADFDDDSIDMALMIGRPDAPARTAIYLFSPRLFPVCSPDLALSLDAPGRLVDVPVLQVHPSRDDWGHWLRGQAEALISVDAIDSHAGLCFDSYDHALKMAARGLGVALGMEPYLAEDLALGTLVRAFPGTDVAAGGVWYLSHVDNRGTENRIRAAHARAFAQWLIGEVEADPDLAALRDAALAERFALPHT